MPTQYAGMRYPQALDEARPRGAPLTEDGIASSGITFHLWRLYQHAWLICLLFPLVDLVRAPIAGERLSLGLGGLVFFAGGYTWLMWPHPASQAARARSRGALLLWSLLTVLVFVFSLGYGPAWLWLFIGLSASAGVLLPMRPAFVVVVLLTLAPLALTVGTTGDLVGVDWPWLIALVLLVRGLGVDMIGVARLGRAIGELHTARSDLARLRVEEEVLAAALFGASLAEIAARLALSEGTVRNHLSTAIQKLGAQNRMEAARLAEQKGWL